MRIAFDVSQTGPRKAGCGYFAEGLIRHLALIDRENEFLLLPAVGDHFWDPAGPRQTCSIRQSNFRRLSTGRTFEEAQQLWRLPADILEARLGHPDIIHFNNFFCPYQLRSARCVFTLHDLAFLSHPEWTTEENRVSCFAGVFRAAGSADLIVAVSHYSREQFLQTFPHYPPERVEVVYPGSRFLDISGDGIRPHESLRPANYWLSVGTLEPRKNHRRLLAAYRRLRSIEPGMPLVIAGAEGWLLEELGDLRPDRDLMLLGYVRDEELLWLYDNCYAFLYPSLFEGFGMPVAEAMSRGAAILTSSTTSLPEVAGDAALLVDPFDEEAIFAGMHRLLSEPSLRDRLRGAAMSRARQFSWTSSAARMVDLYSKVARLPRFADSLATCGDVPPQR